MVSYRTPKPDGKVLRPQMPVIRWRYDVAVTEACFAVVSGGRTYPLLLKQRAPGEVGCSKYRPCRRAAFWEPSDIFGHIEPLGVPGLYQVQTEPA